MSTPAADSRLTPAGVLIAAFFVAAATLLGCGPHDDSAHVTATPPARHALGPAAPFPAEPLSPNELASMDKAARRAWAWHLVERVVAEVPTGAGPLPRWATWYARDDFERLFRKLYLDLGPAGRRARAPFPGEAITGAFAWQGDAMLFEPPNNWTAERYETWRARLTTPDRAAGIIGLNRTLYSPAATRHLLANYAPLDVCPPVVAATAPDAPGLAAGNNTLCFTSEFPSDAVIVKAAWKRLGFNFKVPVYDTDPASLRRRLDAGATGWGAPDRELVPPAGSAFTIELDGGGVFQLAGLHIMSKESRDWAWVTLWWSDRPDGDFGEDRPAALGGPWRNYKMCTAMSFADDEWCSNPHLELGPHNQRTNCIGCHQHGGTALDPETELQDAANVDSRLRAKVRHNFPTDYLWSLRKDPENLARIIRTRIEHHDLHDEDPTP